MINPIGGDTLTLEIKAILKANPDGATIEQVLGEIEWLGGYMGYLAIGLELANLVLNDFVELDTSRGVFVWIGGE